VGSVANELTCIMMQDIHQGHLRDPIHDHRPMKTPLVVVTLVITVRFSGCGLGASDPSPHGPPEADQGPASGSAVQDGPTVGVVALDQGRRWKANPETTEGIANMRLLLDGYPSNGFTPQVMRDTLTSEFARIFERCTMTGEAHEQLHNYLVPLDGMLEGEASDDRFAAISTYLDQYGTYFE